MIDNEFYDDLGDEWYERCDHPIALLRAENAARTPWILQQIQGGAPRRILDIGCGGGFFANAAAQAGHEVTGIDLSVESLAVARRRDETGCARYMQGDASALPFESGQFDVVTALDFLEHVESPPAIIKEASRMLRPSGLFFFHTFNRNPVSWLVVLKGVEWFVRNTPKNMHIYRLFVKPSEVKSACEAGGMRVEKIQGLMPDPLHKGFWKMLATRRVSKDFRFRLTRSLLCGYVGFATKK